MYGKVIVLKDGVLKKQEDILFFVDLICDKNLFYSLFLRLILRNFFFLNTDKLSFFLIAVKSDDLFFGEFHEAVDDRENRMILALHNAFAEFEFVASLSDNDIAGFRGLIPENLNAQILRLAVP